MMPAASEKVVPTISPTVAQKLNIIQTQVVDLLEHRMGFEPMNTGFADQRVSHFAIGAHSLLCVAALLAAT